METFSASLALCGGIHRSSVNSPHKGQWRGALMFSLICAWINGRVNNRETGDLRRHLAHYDVIVMKKIARKSRPIQCVELDHQSGSRKQHCWKFWNPIERMCQCIKWLRIRYKWLHPFWSVGCNYFSIPKLQRFSRWEIWKWMSNLISHFTGHVIMHPCWG